MTGLSVSGNYLFLSSRSQKRVYRYTLPGITGRQLLLYMPAFNKTCDIAFNAGDSLTWAASETSDPAVKCFNTENEMVDYIDISLIPNARGMALDPAGFLWISDVDADKIYQVDLSNGIGDSNQPQAGLNVIPSSNPFSGAVTIQAPGIHAEITVVDMYGRQIEHDTFQESWTWNSSAPAGNYLFIIRDYQGASAILDMVKI
ncbi:MAG: hypothetical protein K8S62_07830 [Candidatus Sabulitectum sp.]|nr:hypothetical protein [Candidatus Sabulitectum sp.]